MPKSYATEKESGRTYLISPSRGDADGQADTSSSNRSGALLLQIHPNHVWLHQMLNPEIAGAGVGAAHTPLPPGKSCTSHLNNSPERRSSSSPFPANHPAAAELGEMKVVLIPPAHARQPGWMGEEQTAGSAKVASASDSSAPCYCGVTGLGRRRGPRQHREAAPKAARRGLGVAGYAPACANHSVSWGKEVWAAQHQANPHRASTSPLPPQKNAIC